MPKNNLTNLNKKRKEDRRRADDRFTWRIICVIAFLGIWTFFLYRFDWPAAIYALPAAFAVLYLLAYIYPKDFIALALLVAAGSFGLWGLAFIEQNTSGRWMLLARIIFAALAALYFFASFYLKKKNGVLTLGKRTIQVIPRKGNYAFIFIACGILLLALLFSVILGSFAALTSIAAALIYLFIAAVYYTVKLI